MNTKPTLFIGSSSEALPVAEEVKKQLTKVADIVMWNDGTVFQKNKSYLESLMNVNMMFDFAVYIFTPDDDLKTRKKKVKTMRDNVLFEMGLSLGRHKNNIGKNKMEDILQLRELKNFEQTLRMLLDYPENDIYRKYISIDYQEHFKK